MSAHQKQKTHILITHVASALGGSLAKSYLDQNCAVFGISTAHIPKDLLSRPDFTLLDVDASQPFSSHLPPFDIIFHLSPLFAQRQALRHHLAVQREHLPQTSNLIAYARELQSRLFIFAPVDSDPQTFHLDAATLFLTGDVYGPGLSVESLQTELEDLIAQAAQNDKVILKNEGLDPIYPAYIKDVIFAVNKIIFAKDKAQVHYLVSDPAQTALTVAYEIQSALAKACGKDIGLFFAGPPAGHDQIPHVEISLDDLSFIPKFHLKEGLEETFEYLAENNQIKTPRPSSLPSPKPFSFQPPQFIPLPAGPQPQSQTQHHSLKTLLAIPKPQLTLNLRKLLLIIALVLAGTFAKTAIDLYLAASALKKAQSAASSGQLTKAASHSKSAKNSLEAAKNKITIATFPLSFVFEKQTTAITNTLEGLIAGAGSLTSLLDGSQQLALDISAIILPEAKSTRSQNQDTAIANFAKAHRQSQQAIELLKNAKSLPLFAQSLKSAAERAADAGHAAKSAYEIASLLPEATGATSPKTYLVLLQNNTELRPGGGFIGNFALVEFDSGKLKNIAVEDIYTIDGQLQEEIEPPRELKEKLGVQRLYLRDSNWSPDFKINAATARDFFKKETAKNVDGVIATDLTFIQNLLAAIGPVTVADYNEEITSDNLFERGEYHSEIGFFPGSTQKRDFFGALTRTIINKIVTGLPTQLTMNDERSTTLPWLKLIAQTKTALEQKHLMMTFDSQNLASYVALHGWDQPLPAAAFNPADDANETRDFIAVTEANLGANKVNRFLAREVSYEMTIGRDADLIGKLTISYTNQSQAETWPAGKYVNFLRVYVPFASGLLEVNNGGNTDINQVEITNQGNLTTFATFVEVPIKSTRQITFTYRISKNIKLETAPTYRLYVSKQPGTDRDPFIFTFNLPQYLSVKSISPAICHPEPPPSVILTLSACIETCRNEANGEGSSDCTALLGAQNTTLTTDLSTDRQFTIEVAKK